jgi:hypothetical protein
MRSRVSLLFVGVSKLGRPRPHHTPGGSFVLNPNLDKSDRDDDLSEPFLVVENKPEASNVGEKRQGIEQGLGNANSLRVPYMLFDCGTDLVLFDVGRYPATERTRNRLGIRDALQANYGFLQDGWLHDERMASLT